MTREEAIEVVKSNWPSAHYTMLAKALTVLIAHDDTIRRADKTVPLAMLKVAYATKTDEELRSVAARYGYKVEEGTP